jgi:hypothetical protein
MLSRLEQLGTQKPAAGSHGETRVASHLSAAGRFRVLMMANVVALRIASTTFGAGANVPRVSRCAGFEVKWRWYGAVVDF